MYDLTHKYVNQLKSRKCCERPSVYTVISVDWNYYKEKTLFGRFIYRWSGNVLIVVITWNIRRPRVSVSGVFGEPRPHQSDCVRCLVRNWPRILPHYQLYTRAGIGFARLQTDFQWLRLISLDDLRTCLFKTYCNKRSITLIKLNPSVEPE